MPIFELTEEHVFPPCHLADESGILAVGGDFNYERLLLAYSQGIFPWPHEGYPLLWFCPQERFVLNPRDTRINQSLRKDIRRHKYEIRFDTCFEEVMKSCQQTKRPGQDQTWITDEMISGYVRLHQLGYAHSVESFLDNQLVGGLYGVSLGKIFFGESMFSTRNNSSKIAFATLCAHLISWDFDLIDCQAQTEHLQRFGAVFIKRESFLRMLNDSIKEPTRRGMWKCELDASQVLTYLGVTCT